MIKSENLGRTDALGAYFQWKEGSVLLIATEIPSKISHCPKDKRLWGAWQQPCLWSGGEWSKVFMALAGQRK